MSKTTRKKKKKNYRLRKSVRRTLGALFMISAIIVAAIPFPDAAAAGDDIPQETAEAAAADVAPDTINYSVSASDAAAITAAYPSTYDGYSKGDEKQAYTIRPINGQYYYYKLYKFNVVDGGNSGIMSKYNSEMKVDTLTLSQAISTGYITVTQTEFNNYYSTGAGAAEIVMDETSIKNADNVRLFETYFPSEYTTLQNNLAKRDAYNQWKDDGENGTAPANPADSDLTITVKPSNLSQEMRYQYYCDYVIENDQHTKYLYDNNYTLGSVIYTENSNRTVVYVPKPVDTSNPTDVAGYARDDYGFLYPIEGQSYDLIGIGEGAFQGVTNVQTLVLPENISYIGDSAFKESFIQSVSIANVERIGNYAFQNCTQLKNVEIGTQTKCIGVEAFSGTALTSVTFPYSLQTIGAGAFSKNNDLVTLDFSQVKTSDSEIQKYAFYDCPKLGSVSLWDTGITKIGDGAFALSVQETGSCTSFEFPSGISKGDDLGDCVLARRVNLQNVKMPNNLGYNSKEELKGHLFYGCTGLACVEFPSSFSNLTFPDTLFAQVTNENFYVKGPENNTNGQEAGTRTSTWACKASGGRYVPYMYGDYYEISDGDYVLLVDGNGTLESCDFANGEVTIDNLEIPGQVGNITVTGIANNCFSDAFLKKIKRLTIADGGQLTEIGDGVFKGATEMTEAYIGDSVEKIGASAFADCAKLENVVIGNSIREIGANAFSGCSSLEEVLFIEPSDTSSFTLSGIGSGAFTTGSNKLTFIGAISPDYGPFAWAMDPGNYVQSDGTRVCYRTPAATYLTAVEYNKSREDGDARQDIPTDLAVILDNRNNYPTLVGYTHYEDIDEDVRSAYENGELLSPANESWIKSALNISVPEGVKSIDAQGYFTNTSQTVSGVEPYTNNTSIAKYFASDKYESNYMKYGLFNGYCGNYSDTDGDREYPNTETGQAEENHAIGNDYVQSISLPDVVYLPDEAFYSCENLQTVQIGDDLEDIGSLPFLDCTSLASVSFGTDQYECNNGIVYENNTDGTKTIVECLASRGSLVGSSTVNLTNDPDLANTTAIEEGAFSQVPRLTTFDLTGVTTIKEIPKSCFEDSSALNTVELPESVRKIDDRAFATDGQYIQVTVRGKEVSLGEQPFDGVDTAYLISYSDSAVRSAAEKKGANVERTLDDTYTVKFYNYDGTDVLKIDYVVAGGDATPPKDDEIPTIAGKTFVGWNRSYENVTEDIFVLAMYESDGTQDDDSNANGGSGNGGSGNGGTGTGTVDGSLNSGNSGSGSSSASTYTLTVTDGIGSGTYAAGTTITITAGTGASGTAFSHWSSSNTGVIFADPTKSSTTITMPASDATVIANFAGQYTLEVEYGSGSGSYMAGTKVAISAIDPPAGKKFSKWTTTTSGLTIESSTKESTTITMPSANAKVTANYVNTTSGSVSGNSTSTKRNSQNGTTVSITKSGISDTDKASAYVTGSSDNFVVKISESLEAADEVQKALMAEYGDDLSRIKYFAMDISLYDATGQTKITNTDGLTVNITMPIPDALKEYAGNNRVASVVDGALDKLNPKFTTIDGVASVTFTATHFSPYTVYVDTANLTATGTLDSTPKTGDGIHPKWFLSLGLACISMILFLKKDKSYKPRLS